MLPVAGPLLHHSPLLRSRHCKYTIWLSLCCTSTSTVRSSQNGQVVFSALRGRFPQLPPHIPLRLRHQWVRLEVQPHNCLHRPHVLPGFGQGLQEGVQGDDYGSHPANRRQQLQKWLSRASYKLCMWNRCVEPRPNVATGIAAFQWWGGDYHASDYKLNLFLRLILALKSYRPFHKLCGSLISFEVSSLTISHSQPLGYMCKHSFFFTVIPNRHKDND